MARILLVPLAALLITGLALAATAATARQATEVAIGDNYFDPKLANVAVGTTVTWRHAGVLPHTVTADGGSFNSGLASGDLLRNGDTFAFTFTQAGTYPYYCAIHGAPGGSGRSGTIVVVPSQPQTPQPTPPPTAPPVTAPPTEAPTPTPTPIPTPSGAPGPAPPSRESPTPSPAPDISSSPSVSATGGPTNRPTPTSTSGDGDGGASRGSSALPIVLAFGVTAAVIAATVAGVLAWRRRQDTGTGNE